MDAVSRYHELGQAWAAAGRPLGCDMYEDFADAEIEYGLIADAFWYANWSDDQRAEWERISRDRPDLVQTTIARYR